MAGLVVGRTLKPERMAGPGVILVVDDQHIVSEMAQDKWATSWRPARGMTRSRPGSPFRPCADDDGGEQDDVNLPEDRYPRADRQSLSGR